MIEVVKFKPQADGHPTLTYSNGRNGIIQTSGIEVSNTSMNTIMLSPLARMGEASVSCFVEIPNEDIDALILAMQRAKNRDFDEAELAKDILIKNGYVGFFVSSEEIQMIAAEEQRELTIKELAEVLGILSNNDLETGLCEEAVRGAISEACCTATDHEWEEQEIDLQKSAWDIVEDGLTPDEQ